jgi:hypothetical protein
VFAACAACAARVSDEFLELLSLDKRREALESTPTTADLDASEVPLADDNADDDDDDDADDDADDANVGSEDTDDESVCARDEDSRSGGSLFHASFGAGARVRRRVVQPAS